MYYECVQAAYYLYIITVDSYMIVEQLEEAVFSLF